MKKRKDKTRKVELLESEIQEIIRCIEDVPYGIFTFMNYNKIVNKFCPNKSEGVVSATSEKKQVQTGSDTLNSQEVKRMKINSNLIYSKMDKLAQEIENNAKKGKDWKRLMRKWRSLYSKTKGNSQEKEAGKIE